MSSNLHNFIYSINNIHSLTCDSNISELNFIIKNSTNFINTIEMLTYGELWIWDDTMIWDDSDIWYDTK